MNVYDTASMLPIVCEYVAFTRWNFQSVNPLPSLSLSVKRYVTFYLLSLPYLALFIFVVKALLKEYVLNVNVYVCETV